MNHPNIAQVFRADLDTPTQLIAFFAGVLVTTAVLTIWSAITRAARATATRLGVA